MLPKIKNAIVFLGDSITDGGEWAEGLEVLRDGTIVTTTYGHWVANDPAYIMSVRLKLSELDKKYQVIAKKQHE